MKQTSGALSMLLAAYRSVLSATFIKGCTATRKSKIVTAVAAALFSAAFSASSSAAINIEGDEGLSAIVKGNSPTEFNDINANDSGYAINFSGSMDLSKHQWEQGGEEIGQDKKNLTGFIAADISDNNQAASGTINVAANSTISGSTFQESGESSPARTYLVGHGNYYGGDGSHTANANGTISVGAGSTLSSMQMAGSTFSFETEQPLANPMNINVTGRVNFADATTDKPTTVSGSFVSAATAELDEGSSTIHNANVNGSIYIGENVNFVGDDKSAGTMPEGDNVEYDGIVAAQNYLGGNATGSIEVKGSVTNSQLWGAAIYRGAANGTVIIDKAAKVQLSSGENTNPHLTAVFARGDKNTTLNGTVSLYGQYGAAAEKDKTSVSAINVIDASTFTTANANLTIKQDKATAEASSIPVVNVISIDNSTEDDSVFTQANSASSVANVNVTVDGYSKVNTLNAMYMQKGTYAGKLVSNVTVGENAEIDTINGVTLADGAAFTGSTEITQNFTINGKVKTLHIQSTAQAADTPATDEGQDSEESSAQKEQAITPSLLSLAAAPRALAAPKATQAKFTTNLELNNGSIESLADGPEGSELNVTSYGQSSIKSLGNNKLNELIVDTAGVPEGSAAFSTDGDLNPEVLQVVDRSGNTSKAVQAKSISTNELRYGPELFSYNSAVSETGNKLNLGTLLSMQNGDVLVTINGEQQSVSELEGVQVTKKTNDNAKSLSEAVVGSVALLNQGSEFVANTGLDAAAASVALAGGNSAFGAVQAGYSEYNTGSSVDLTAVTGIVGYARGFKFGGDQLTAAVFLDLGHGSSESHVHGTSNDADHDYYGLGVAARYAFENGFFLDGSLRGGQADTDFDGKFQSIDADYDSDTAYFGAHVGAGYKFAVNDDLSLTPYVRYTLTWMDSDSVKMSTGDRFKIDSVTAHGVQAGMDLDWNLSNVLTLKAGLGYIGVWNGDADAEINSIAISSSPSIEGNTGVARVGLHIAPEASSFSVDLDAAGYAGDRQGGMGSVMLNYAF